MKELDFAEATLKRIRQRIAKAQADKHEIVGSGKYDASWAKRRADEIVEEARRANDVDVAGAEPDFRELGRFAAAWSGPAQMERAKFVKPRLPEFATESEKQMFAALQTQNELLAEMAASQRLQRAPLNAVNDIFTKAFEAGELAQARVALQELQFRAESDSGAKGYATRADAMVSRMPPPPEVAERVARAAQLPELIRAAARAIETGEDVGVRGEAAAQARLAVDAARAQGQAAHFEIVDGVAQAVFDN
jgi:hypothetical protein